MSDIRPLSIAENDQLSSFLLKHMDMETRHKLMSELPLVYAKLYPSVNAEVIAFAVRDRIKAWRADD